MKVLNKVNINKILFFDIETRSLLPELTEDSPYFEAWQYDSRKTGDLDVEELKEEYFSKSPLKAEFSAICCISVGYINSKNELKTKSYFGTDEKKILVEFYSDLDQFVDKAGFTHLCGHAVNWFDIPFIGRRSLANNITIHPFLDVVQSPPWERKHIIDTKELFAMGGQSMSLIALTTALGLPSPKQSLVGSEVNQAYWNGGIDEIVKYCEEGDVPAVVNIYRKFTQTQSHLDLQGEDFDSELDKSFKTQKLDLEGLAVEGSKLRTKKEKELYTKLVEAVSLTK